MSRRLLCACTEDLARQITTVIRHDISLKRDDEWHPACQWSLSMMPLAILFFVVFLLRPIQQIISHGFHWLWRLNLSRPSFNTFRSKARIDSTDICCFISNCFFEFTFYFTKDKLHPPPPPLPKPKWHRHTRVMELYLCKCTVTNFGLNFVTRARFIDTVWFVFVDKITDNPDWVAWQIRFQNCSLQVQCWLMYFGIVSWNANFQTSEGFPGLVLRFECFVIVFTGEDHEHNWPNIKNKKREREREREREDVCVRLGREDYTVLGDWRSTEMYDLCFCWWAAIWFVTLFFAVLVWLSPAREGLNQKRPVSPREGTLVSLEPRPSSPLDLRALGRG